MQPRTWIAYLRDVGVHAVRAVGAFFRRPAVLVSLGLVGLIAAIYWQVWNFDFVNYDDDCYIFRSRNVITGLSWENVKWAFTTGYLSNWHPLTHISYQIDVSLFGLRRPGWFHLENVVFHTFNTILLFYLLRRMTGAFWRSALVAALFAVHPLHVESVAWIAERKDVMSVFFGFLSLWAYLGYVRRPCWSSAGIVCYILVSLLLAVSLMYKPMLVTWPAVLLLLDFWPLGRLRLERGFWRRLGLLVLEKSPLMLLAIGSSIATYLAQKWGGSVTGGDVLPFPFRVMSASMAYVVYLGKAAWPVDLCVFYPYWQKAIIIFDNGAVASLPAGQWQAPVALAVLGLITVAVLWQLRRRPYLAAGWFWYLGTLVPVVGLVQVGGQAYADRYTYVPLIGIFWIVVWGGKEIVDGLARRWTASAGQRALLAVTPAVALISIFTTLTYFQIGHWQNSFTLFNRAVTVVPKVNHIAENNLGAAYEAIRDPHRALIHYLAAIDAVPSYAGAMANAARIYSSLDDHKSAIKYAQSALLVEPKSGLVRLANAYVYFRAGLWNESLAQHESALTISPDDPVLRNNFGLTLVHLDRYSEAAEQFEKAVNIAPPYVDARVNLAKAYAALGKMKESMMQYREVVEKYYPDKPEVLNNVAWMLATNPNPSYRNGPMAVNLAQHLLEITNYGRYNALDTLAAAYAAAGDFPNAIKAAEESLTMLNSPKDAYFRQQVKSRLDDYREGRPFVEPPSRKDFLPPTEPPPITR